MKRLLILLAASFLTFTACDIVGELLIDEHLTNRVDKLEDKVEELEKLCGEMNTNIESLQIIVDALQTRDYITSVAPVRKDGKDVGYTIVFAKKGPITIFHGEDGPAGQPGADGEDGVAGADGEDGYTPVIGVRKDTDGIYYWTLDGDWLLDEDGNKVRAEGSTGSGGQPGQDGTDGEDGRDGITPQLRIENGEWQVSYDGGKSWNDLDMPAGGEGNGGESFFKDVRPSETDVTFVLNDDSELVVPRAAPLAITFEAGDLMVMTANETRTINYEVTSVSDNINIDVVSSADIKAKVLTPGAKKGRIEVKVSDAIDEYSKVVVFVSDDVQVIMHTLTFEEEEITVSDVNEAPTAGEGGTVTLYYNSNTTCEVMIPEGVDWIYYLETKAPVDRSISIIVEPNNTGNSREATVTLRTASGTSFPYTVSQEAQDLTEDKAVVLLQKAEAGYGIDIVLLGDGYTADMIENGTYEQVMRDAMEYLFVEEPYKSFRHLFNVYMVNAVSTDGFIGGETVFSTYFEEGTTFVGGDLPMVIEYALKALPQDERMSETMVVVMQNSDKYAGTCHFLVYYHGDWGSGYSISFFPAGNNPDQFRQLLNHEANGHGFAKLDDEYAYEFMGAITPEALEERKPFDLYGANKNTDITNDPAQVKWAHFLEDSRYDNEDLGIYEGGSTYYYGVWRPTFTSIMVDNVGGFNAPSREAIYYRIHKLAYGEDWVYDYEKFVEYDAINRTPEALEERAAAAAQQRLSNFEPLAPPVIINKDWRELLEEGSNK